ncbi:MAG: ABC transporter permease [Dehalococcoidia bacterium]
MKRTLAVMRKETRHILRSPVTFVLVVMSPLLLLLIMALMFSIDVRGVPIAVMDYDHSLLSRSYISGLISGGELRLLYYAENYDEIEELFFDGEVRAAVVIPSGFEQDLLRQTGAQIQIISDGTEPISANYALRHIRTFSQDFTLELLMSSTGGQAQQPVNLSIRPWYNPELKPVVGFVPGLIAVVMGLPAVAVAAAVVKEKEQGTMEMLIATPLRGWELLLGKLPPYIAAGLLNVILATTVGVFWLGVPFVGSFPLYLLLAIAFFIASFGLSLLISTFLKRQMVAILLALLVFLYPSFFLSGLMYPVSSMSTEMQIVANLLPATHLVAISQGLFLKGLGLDVLWSNAVILLAIGLVTIGLAIWRFRKKLA